MAFPFESPLNIDGLAAETICVFRELLRRAGYITLAEALGDKEIGPAALGSNAVVVLWASALPQYILAQLEDLARLLEDENAPTAPQVRLLAKRFSALYLGGESAQVGNDVPT